MFNYFIKTSLLKLRLGYLSFIQCSACFLLALIGLSAEAAEQVSDSNENEVLGSGFSAGSNADYFIQVFGALVFVVIVIFLLALLMRKFSMMPGASSGPIKVISGISIGGKERLLLIEVGGEQILVGTSPGSIKKIHKLSSMLPTQSKETNKEIGKQSFSKLLNAVSGRGLS